MKIWKFELKITRSQLVKMPLKSEIMDIQMQKNRAVMWALCDPGTEEIEVKINMYGTGSDVNPENNQYLGTVQQDGWVWHFFMEL